MDNNTAVLILSFILVLGPSLVGLGRKWLEHNETDVEDKIYRESHRMNTRFIKLENDMDMLRCSLDDISKDLQAIRERTLLTDKKS